MTNVKGTEARFVGGTSRGPRNAHTFALQMAMDKQRQLETAARIRKLRGPKPQPVVADEVGVRLRTYQHWEAGDGIAWPNLQKLAEVFKVTENFLLYGEQEPQGPQTQLDRIEGMLEQLLETAFQRELEDADHQADQRESGSGEGAAGSAASAKA